MNKPDTIHSATTTNNERQTLVSFDIFDTLLTRLVAIPISVFYFAAREAIKENLISCYPEIYVKQRREAEKLARIGQPDGEVDDTRIFQFLTRLLSVSSEVGKLLQQLEIDSELKLLIPVPGSHERIQRHRDKGDQVVFVSDTYHTKDTLIGFLKKHNFWNDADQLWVSSEHGASKMSSRLFHKFLDYNKVQTPKDVYHYGNNKRIDVDGAAKAGISPVWLPEANPSRYEYLLETFRDSSGGLTSLLAGAGRMLRLKYADDSPKLAGLAKIVGNVVGPSFTLYVLWLLKEAKAKGINRLFFVSRDGYVPYLIAKKISTQIAPDIEISYFYGSRQAWHIAGLFEFDRPTLNWLFSSLDGPSGSSFIKRTGLEWEELTSIVPEISNQVKNPYSPLTKKELEYLKSIILSNKKLQDRILNEAKARRALLLEYLSQEGFNPKEKNGIVEMGWVGRTKMSFERVIGTENSTLLHWFYLGLLNIHQEVNLDRVHTFLYGGLLRFEVIHELPVTAESFCLAPHGSVLGFEKKDGKVIPIFREGNETKLDEWGRPAYLKMVDEYCDNLPLTDVDHTPGFDLRSAAYHLLKTFTEQPGRDEAALWGSVPYDYDQAGSATYHLAPPIKVNYQTIKEALIFGTIKRASGSGHFAGVSTRPSGASCMPMRRCSQHRAVSSILASHRFGNAPEATCVA